MNKSQSKRKPTVPDSAQPNKTSKNTDVVPVWKNNLDLNGVRELPLGTDYFCTVPNKSRMIFPLVKVKSSKLVSRAECSICQNVMGRAMERKG